MSGLARLGQKKGWETNRAPSFVLHCGESRKKPQNFPRHEAGKNKNSPLHKRFNLATTGNGFGDPTRGGIPPVPPNREIPDDIDMLRK